MLEVIVICYDRLSHVLLYGDLYVLCTAVVKSLYPNICIAVHCGQGCSLRDTPYVMRKSDM